MAHYGVDTALGRTREGAMLRDGKGFFNGSSVKLQGRQALDALRIVRALPGRFDDLRLGTVSQAILGRGKTIVGEEWQSMPELIAAKFREDKQAFADYCLEDARLVRDILRKEKLIELSVARSKLVGLTLERSWGSVMPFENLYALELRKRDVVVPTRGVDAGGNMVAPGGLVMEPKAGLYANILVFDFKSLYPSIMRTFNIDPLAHAVAAAGRSQDPVVAPNGAPFDRARGIMPGILDEFTARREQAKRDGKEVDSYVYKILLNSFYGVLGTDSCRFASGALAGAITTFGHLILRWMRKHFEGLGCDVLYGDTDSLFVDARLAGDVAATDALARAATLCADANQALAAHVQAAYGLTSRLELEVDTVFRRLLLPSARGGESSRAKSYAGLAADRRGETLEVKGMEAVRGDWTDAAKSLQRDLLDLLFHDAPPRQLEARLHDEIKRVLKGERDPALVYRKTIRKPLAAYGSNAPHVRAAALLPRPVRVVRYVITRDGPQPLGFVTAPLDYEHYVDTQILPIAEGLAGVGGFHARRPEQSRSLFGD
jgi:DNA polymerase-2